MKNRAYTLLFGLALGLGFTGLALALSPLLRLPPPETPAQFSARIKTEFRKIHAAAERGDVFAQLDLGMAYAKGAGVAQNNAQAMAWYRKAAAQGNMQAQNTLGEMYANGQGVAQNDVQAVAWYRKAASQGYAPAQRHLGAAYANGKGVAQNNVQAVDWYHKAAKQGDTQAIAQAIDWLRKGAERGDVIAQLNLGMMYELRRDVDALSTSLGVKLRHYYTVHDQDQAIAWYRKAAEQGNAQAQFNLGVVYANGVGVARDSAQAVVWYRKAAEQGHVEAQRNLGDIYRRGDGIAQDQAQAAVWYRKAAEQGDVSAQRALGNMYLSGEGVAQDSAQAAVWYRKAVDIYSTELKEIAEFQTTRAAAEKGDAKAQASLGDMYASGKGTAWDYTQAAIWYRKAAEQGITPTPTLWKKIVEFQAIRAAAEKGDAKAQASLGEMYEGGEGVAQDDAQAMAWWHKAAAQGNADAQYSIGVMYAMGFDVAQDDAQAVAWYRKAAEQGHAGAQTSLGVMYMMGRGVAQDKAQAVAWWRKAAAQGDDDAQYELHKLGADSDNPTKPPQ